MTESSVHTQNLSVFFIKILLCRTVKNATYVEKEVNFYLFDYTFETIENVMDTTSDSLCISKISSYNNSKNIENMTNVEVIESDEIQFNKETNKDTNKLASKRKRSMPFTSSKRFCVPRYIGDLQRKDFTSDKSWQIVCVCMIMYIIQEVNVQSYSKK